MFGAPSNTTQNRITEYVCLMVGLRSFMIILTIASLHSKMKRDARWLQMCAFGRKINAVRYLLFSHE